MSTSITLANGDHMAQLMSLISRRITEGSSVEESNETHIARQHMLKPLLSGGPEGAVWLIGPVRAPLGYAILSFGWSLALGGREAWVEDIYIRPSVRRRGIATEVMHAVSSSLRQAGLGAMHARLHPDDNVAQAFCTKAGLRPQPDLIVMSERL